MPSHDWRHSAMSCAKMAEPIDMPFGLWTRIGRKKTQVQSYLPGGINMPSWEGTLVPPGEYDWTIRLWRRCDLVKLLWPLVITCYGVICTQSIANAAVRKFNTWQLYGDTGYGILSSSSSISNSVSASSKFCRSFCMHQKNTRTHQEIR